MNNIFVAFFTVITMLLYALPGYLLIKSKMIDEGGISNFAKLLMFVCQPVLVIYSLTVVPFSVEFGLKLLTALVFMFFIQFGSMFVMYLIFRNKMENVKYRIYAIACCMGNYAFMGIPVLEAMIPGNPEAVAYTSMASVALNVSGWTFASFIISQDKKYISPKKVFFNPVMLAFYVALPLFLFNIKLPGQLNTVVTTLGRMTTPLCMLILGMRLATTTFKSVFFNVKQYMPVAVKQILLPFAALMILKLLPVDHVMRESVYIMLCCPIASVVLNFSELIGQGQKTASEMVLLGTALSSVTIPFMMIFA